MSEDKENITYFLHEPDEIISNEYDLEFDINNVLQEIENDEFKLPKLLNYDINFTIKDLMMICEYYGFAKELKTKKYNKEEIIHFLVDYELNPLNNDIVNKRQNMWFYINQLKNDKFMKKYLLWS